MLSIKSISVQLFVLPAARVCCEFQMGFCQPRFRTAHHCYGYGSRTLKRWREIKGEWETNVDLIFLWCLKNFWSVIGLNSISVFFLSNKALVENILASGVISDRFFPKRFGNLSSSSQQVKRYVWGASVFLVNFFIKQIVSIFNVFSEWLL